MPAGSFSFPNVPPNSELEYEVELVDFDPADEVGQGLPSLHLNGISLCSSIRNRPILLCRLADEGEG